MDTCEHRSFISIEIGIYGKSVYNNLQFFLLQKFKVMYISNSTFKWLWCSFFVCKPPYHAVGIQYRKKETLTSMYHTHIADLWRNDSIFYHYINIDLWPSHVLQNRNRLLSLRPSINYVLYLPPPLLSSRHMFS